MSSWNDRLNIFTKQATPFVKKVKMDDFVHSTYISLNKQYFYGESPKTGCSTIKKVLIQAELGKRIDFESPDYIHYREFNPFLTIRQVGNLIDFFQRKDIFKFCFVRNPYARFLSCYLDKIVNNRFQNQQNKIQSGLDVNDNKIFTFEEFVNLAIVQPVMFMDQHWRTQYYQTYQTNIDYDFIGRFENFQEDFFHVLNQLNINPDDFYDVEKSHATNASELIRKYYTPELADKIYEKYKIDFEYFDYSKDFTINNKLT